MEPHAYYLAYEKARESESLSSQEVKKVNSHNRFDYSPGKGWGEGGVFDWVQFATSPLDASKGPLHQVN